MIKFLDLISPNPILPSGGTDGLWTKIAIGVTVLICVVIVAFHLMKQNKSEKENSKKDKKKKK